MVSWVLGMYLTNEFGETLMVFEQADGTWKPFMDITRQVDLKTITAQAQQYVEDLGMDIHVLTMVEAKQAAAESALALVCRQTFGDETHLYMVH